MSSRAASPPPSEYPGQRLGLPMQGPGSIAGWGRRFLALALDWIASSLVVVAFIGREGYLDSNGLLVLLVFWAELTFFTALAGGSFGQLAVGVRVVRTDGRPLSLLRAAGRSAAICVVVPPLVFNPDGRGLHDLGVDSVALQSR